ncbi:glutathione S-transferase family protein [Myxococcota bacterium]|nr:glutathione S-transferase family protein [Myxococcota bacterium]
MSGWVLWGSELSPFSLKVEAMLRFAGLHHRLLPAQGGFFDALRGARRRQAVVQGRLALMQPPVDPLDEFPLVPFLFGPAGENLYDSSAIGAWLDRKAPSGAAPLLPSADGAVHFAIRLVDEALDELGLYLVHHRRWVLSARDNDAGVRLAREYRPLAGPLAAVLARTFPARQVRRLPYLFSVAPVDAGFDDLPRRLRPPPRRGFPPTHALLETIFDRLLDALEPLLGRQPFLFGERFTLADASLYGQLGMNRADPTAHAALRRAAPAVHAWVERLARHDFRGHQPAAPVFLGDAHAPLLSWLARAFVPLMQQNHEAWRRHRATGEATFNERAFIGGRALYDGTLLGRPFRSVAKTFQVRVWRELRGSWQALDGDARRRFLARLPDDAAGRFDAAAGGAGGEIRVPPRSGV